VDDVPEGFAHTPAGALLAAVVICYDRALEPGARRVTMADVVPGPGQAATLRLIRDGSGGSSGARSGERPIPVAGFSFASYTATVATIDLAFGPTSSGVWQVGPLTVRWMAGDWKLVVPASGVTGGPVTTVASMAGFVQWGPG
jgi:hypothetical protein